LEKLVVMSKKELSRYGIMEKTETKAMSQKEGAELLGISERHYRRLLKRYRENGVEGLISKKRGKPSNRRCPDKIKEKTLKLLKGKYKDFGPTFASQKLEKDEQIKLSRETLRLWMIEEGLWKGKKQKAIKLHQSRIRRSQEGELIQVDGSPHDWFEGRRKPCSLLGYIDDATSKVMHLKFVENETTAGYLKMHGRPESLYTDRLSVFRVNTDKEGYKGKGLTQVGRALKELGIELICANSPQAKGRIERLFNTLQDRLVKEMRLKKLSTLEEGNKYLKEYIKEHNAHFSVVAQNKENKHKALLKEHNLEEILCYKSERTLSKNLEVSYEGRILQISQEKPSRAMRRAKVTVIETLEGEIKIEYQGKNLEYKELYVKDSQGRVLNRKSLLGGTIPKKGMVA